MFRNKVRQFNKNGLMHSQKNMVTMFLSHIPNREMRNYSRIPLKVLLQYFAKRLYKNLTKTSVTEASLLKQSVDLRLKVHNMAFIGQTTLII